MQKYRPSKGDPGLPVLKIRELGQGYCGNDSERCSTDIDGSVTIEDGDLVFSWSGTLLLRFWAGGRAGLNQHLFKVTSEQYPSWFYYAWTKHHLARFVMLAKDRATTMGHIKRSALAESSVVVPPTRILEQQTKLMQPIVDEIVSNMVENRRLALLRDTLLPKLMSGEIDVSKVDLTQLNSHLAQIRIPKDTPLATTDLGFKFDRSHYSPLLHNPSSSQQQWATIWFLRITQCSFSNMQCVFRTYDETATPDIEFVAQCAMFLTHNYLLIRHGVEYVRQNDMLFVEHTRQKAERIPDP